MPKVCRKSPESLPKVSRKSAKSLPTQSLPTESLPTESLLKVCRKSAESLPKVCQKSAKSLPKVCPKSALCQSMSHPQLVNLLVDNMFVEQLGLSFKCSKREKNVSCPEDLFFMFYTQI